MATIINSGDLLTDSYLSTPLKVYAGPGAGKTHFLVENIKNIISKDSIIKGSLNKKILCITYTNAAVDEIKSRLDTYTNNVEVYTIHGFIIRHLIIPYQSELKRIMKLDFDISVHCKKIISSQIEGLGLLHGIEREDIYNFIDSETDMKSNIEYSKTSMSKVQVNIKKFIESSEMHIDKASKIIENHKKHIKKFIWEKARKLTHDEILYFGYRLIQENSTIVYALRVQFPFIFVDEFQDTNPLQTMLIQHIGRKNTIIGVIGDIAQSIYSFQGAKPNMFLKFDIEGREISDLQIKGNRRSTQNIINLCNYIRQNDELSQVSVKNYDSEEAKINAEKKKVVFLLGDNENINEKIKEIINSGGVILTRAWAAAFHYMDNVSDSQKKALKKIYNSYYVSTIDIRSEISEHANVMWVKAFKFIMTLINSYGTKSVSDILDAFQIYVDINRLVKSKQLTANIILKIGELISEVSQTIKSETLVIDVIKTFNSKIRESSYKEIEDIFNLNLKSKSNSDVFSIECFSDYDKEELIKNVSSIEWNTSVMLFEKVFSSNSKYMTVHQAKGLEWKKVIVSLTPTKFDKTTFNKMFLEPHILDETSQDEFTRLFYVACSRAEEELYIHLNDCTIDVDSIKKNLNQFCVNNKLDIFYEFIE